MESGENNGAVCHAGKENRCESRCVWTGISKQNIFGTKTRGTRRVEGKQRGFRGDEL